MSRRTARLRFLVRQALRTYNEKGQPVEGNLTRAAVRDFLARNGRPGKWAIRPEKQERLAAAVVHAT